MTIKSITDFVKEKVVAGHSGLLSTINAGVNFLFWDIGTVINSGTTHISRIDNGKSQVEEISDNLIPFFGDYLNSVNIPVMMKFADRCQHDIIGQIAAAINWDYIPYFFELEEEGAWIFYMKLMHIRSLDTDGLHKKIVAGTFEKEGTIDEGVFMRSHSKPFYQNSGELYFGKARGEVFRKLFEPQDDHISIASTTLAKKPNNKISRDIYERVLEFQAETQSMLNSQFNILLWEIGAEVIRLSNVSNIKVTEIVEACVKEIGIYLPSVFNKTDLSFCVTFAEKYRNPNDHEEIADIISWPYLKVILDVADKDKRLMIARQVFNNGIGIEELKGMISDGCFNFMDTNSLPLKNTGIDRSVTTETMDNNQKVTITQELVEPIINPKNDINRNIYKNLELLAFLKDNIYNH